MSQTDDGGQPASPSSTERTLFHIHDILFALRKSKAQGAQLTGKVTRVSSRSNKVLFVTIRDATGHIQLKFSPESLSEDGWQTAKKIRDGNRVHVSGTTGFNPFGEKQVPTIFVQSVKMLDSTPFSDVDLALREDEAITKAFFLARIRKKAAEFFTTSGYEEFEPVYLSSFPVRSRITALRVVFPGFGAPAFMAPSPASQLFQAVVTSPTSRVFCTARCFSNEIRDGYTSAESLALFCCQLNTGLSELITLAVEAIKFVFNDITTAPELEGSKSEWLGPVSWKSLTCDWNDAPLCVDIPTVFVLQPTPDSGGHAGVTNVVRILWPSDRVFVEGHTGLLDSTLPVGIFSMHLERMVPILRDVILRRLRHL